MTEMTAWFIICTLVYIALYLIVSMTITYVWSRWAMNKTSVFVRYNLQYAIKKEYPAIYSFMANYHWLYNILYVGLWPISIPVQFTIMTKSVNRSLQPRKYYYY